MTTRLALKVIEQFASRLSDGKQLVDQERRRRAEEATM